MKTLRRRLDSFTKGLNDRANAVALFGAPGAAVTLSSRDRVDSPFSAQGGGDAPGPELSHPGRITVVETDSKGDGFQDSITAWTFEDINPKDGSPFPAPTPDLVTSLGRFRCPAADPPVLQQFRRGRWQALSKRG